MSPERTLHRGSLEFGERGKDQSNRLVPRESLEIKFQALDGIWLWSFQGRNDTGLIEICHGHILQIPK